ncbi:MAG: hypothetical protein GY846_17555 [Deltaproteobacteria bacterium]|nr:hypothetical protein [Deltaproteobacteria bacterium]
MNETILVVDDEPDIFDFVHLDDRETTKKEFAKWVHNEPPSITLENRQVNQVTGEIHDVRWACALKYDDEDNLTGINSIAHDFNNLLSAIILKSIQAWTYAFGFFCFHVNRLCPYLSEHCSHYFSGNQLSAFIAFCPISTGNIYATPNCGQN